MGLIDMVEELKPCPFCGADALLKWVVDDHAFHNGHGGKALRVSCARDGECPSPSWTEVVTEHEDDVACLISVTKFWNRRAEDWEPDEINRLRVELAQAESALRRAIFERDRAQRASVTITDAARPTTGDTDDRT